MLAVATETARIGGGTLRYIAGSLTARLHTSVPTVGMNGETHEPERLLKEAGKVVVEMLVNSDLHPSVRRKSVYDRARALLAKLPKEGA